jgi:hypothetical protein
MRIDLGSGNCVEGFLINVNHVYYLFNVRELPAVTRGARASDLEAALEAQVVRQHMLEQLHCLEKARSYLDHNLNQMRP